MTRQVPLPGTGGRIRYGRTAAASTQDRPAFGPGTLPLGWKTIVDPASVLIHVSIPGEPHPKARPRHTLARYDHDNEVVVQGHTYNPKTNEVAEDNLRWVFLAARTNPRPTPGPVGVLIFFRTKGTQADADNLAKTVLDAMNGSILDDDQQVTELHVHLLRSCTDPGTDLLVWSTSRRTPGG